MLMLTYGNLTLTAHDCCDGPLRVFADAGCTNPEVHDMAGQLLISASMPKLCLSANKKNG